MPSAQVTKSRFQVNKAIFLLAITGKKKHLFFRCMKLKKNLNVTEMLRFIVGKCEESCDVSRKLTHTVAILYS